MKIANVRDRRTSTGRLFHARGPATAKARSPIVERCLASNRTSAVDAERSRRRESTSDSGWINSDRYCGAAPFRQRCTRTQRVQPVQVHEQWCHMVELACISWICVHLEATTFKMLCAKHNINVSIKFVHVSGRLEAISVVIVTLCMRCLCTVHSWLADCVFTPAAFPLLIHLPWVRPLLRHLAVCLIGQELIVLSVIFSNLKITSLQLL